MQLENKTAVIYGAGGAIGEAVARAFAKEGARAFLTGKSKEATEALTRTLAAEIGSYGIVLFAFAQMECLERIL